MSTKKKSAGLNARWRRLVRAREELNITAEEMAMRLGEDPAQYANWENDSPTPPVSVVWRAEAQATGVMPRRRLRETKTPMYQKIIAAADPALTVREIARRVGCSPAYALETLRDHGLLDQTAGYALRRGARKQMTEERLARYEFVRQNREQGGTLAQAAAVLGITRERVRQMEVKLGLPSRHLEKRSLDGMTQTERARLAASARALAKAEERAANIEAIEAMLKAGISARKAGAALGLSDSQLLMLSKGRDWGKLSRFGRWRD